MGPCEELGGRSSHAYLASDLRCPESTDKWTKAGTQKALSGVVLWKFDEHHCIKVDQKIEENHREVCIEDLSCAHSFIVGGSFDKVRFNVATAGISSVIQQKSLAEQCRWRFAKRQWKCIN